METLIDRNVVLGSKNVKKIKVDKPMVESAKS